MSTKVNLLQLTNKFLRVFACVIPIRGARRSILYDVQRGDYHFIPNSLFDVIQDLRNRAIGEVMSAYEEEDIKTLNEYIEFLISNEFAFLLDEQEKDLFPDLPETWDTPALIHNAIIDFDPDSNHDLSGLVDQLDELGCRHLELRFFYPTTTEILVSFLEPLNSSRIVSINIKTIYKEGLTENQIRNLARKFFRVFSIEVFNSPYPDREVRELEYCRLIFYPFAIHDETHCGAVSPAFFSVHPEMFMESKLFNNCLNRKLGIDKYGQIKNCPSLPESFGHCRDTRLIEAISKPGFQDRWKIRKDDISVCRFCEFRYMCTDCRAYTAEPEDSFSKPAKCSYDPFSVSWKAESSAFSSNPST